VTARLAQPFAIAGQSLRVCASVGVAVGPHDAADADGLLRHADAAMYRSKGRSSAPAGGR
jgi:predicted signal transduction protein with EAL and GGDEF domain